jgi:hypothetical protein
MRLAGVFVLIGMCMAMQCAPQRTQIVAQWSDAPGLDALFPIEDALIDEEGGLFEVDGHDIGSGTFNVFIYAEDAKVESSLRHIVEMAERGAVPEGMKLAIAQYLNAERTDWAFKPVYPADLKSFAIFGPERE